MIAGGYPGHRAAIEQLGGHLQNIWERGGGLASKYCRGEDPSGTSSIMIWVRPKFGGCLLFSVIIFKRSFPYLRRIFLSKISEMIIVSAKVCVVLVGVKTLTMQTLTLTAKFSRNMQKDTLI